MNYNLPPGVSESDIPGNRPEDMAWEWEQFHSAVDTDCDRNGLTDQDANMIWKIGLSAWETAKDLGAKFPHE